MPFCRSFGDAIRKAARKVQSSLPVIGLISRLAAPEGGVESDELVGETFVSYGFPGQVRNGLATQL